MPEKKVRVVYQAPFLTKIKPYKHVGIYARVSTRSPEQMNSLSAQVSRAGQDVPDGLLCPDL